MLFLLIKFIATETCWLDGGFQIFFPIEYAIATTDKPKCYVVATKLDPLKIKSVLEV